MSSTVDNRIVNMQFNNAQFESGVKNSVKSLGDLKQGLKLESSASGLTNLQKIGNAFSLAGIEEGANRVSQSLTGMSVVGITALVNLTNSAVEAGKKFVSSLTIDPITDGLSEYETKMDAIQTIMTNTSSKGTTLDDINGALGQLNEYSDKTIYNFAQMTDNIGKMTAAGLGLNDSVTVVQGLSNVAAGFGVDATRMAGATYQMSQALSAGVVKAQDWMSMEQSGMGGEMLQKSLEETAIEMGKVIDTSGTFKSSLEQGWLTTDVFVASMNKMQNNQGLIDAAQNVTSLTKLLGVMKESVGSGWATTWENIFGNKDQSTKFFTGINNGFGALIGPSTDARNAMLSFWNANGGRDAIIEALSTAFKSLMGIISPIHKAFRDIFPVDTGERIVAISMAIRDLVEKFKITERTSINIGRSFKGLFAVLSVGVEVFKFVAKAIGLVIGAFMPGTGGLLGGLLAGTAGVGDFLVAIRNVIVDSNIFGKALEKIGIVMDYVKNTIAVATDVMSTLFDKLKEIMSPYITNIKDAISTSTLLTDAIGALTRMFDNLSSSGADSFSEKLTGALSSLADVGERVKESFGWVGPILDVILPKLEEVGNVLKDKLSPVLEFIWSKLKQLTLGDVGTLLAGGGLIMIGKSVKGLIDSVKGSLEPIQDITSGFKDVLGGITGSLEAFQTKLKADALFKIAAAIGILAVSIVMLSMIEPEALKKAIYALSIVIGELAASMLVLQKSSMGSSGLTGRLIALGIAILLLTKAIKTLGELDPKVLNQGVVALAAVLTTLALFTKFTSGKGIETSMGSIVGLALAILILTVAVKKFGELDPAVLDQGVQGLSACLVSLALFMRLAGKPERMVAIGLGMIGIATSMLIFASAIGKLGELSSDQLQNGLVGFGVILSEILIMLHLLPDNTSMVKAAIGLGMIGGAMYIIAGAVALFGIMPIATIVQGLLALTIVIAEMTAAAVLMKDSLGAGVAMLLMAVAINMLVPAIALLGNLELKTIGTALLALAGIFAVIGLAGWLLAPLAPVIMSLAISIAILGAGVWLVGAGLIAFAAGLTAVALGGGAFVSAFVAMLTAVISLIPFIATKLGEGIQAIALAIMLAWPVVIEALKLVFEGLIQLWAELIPPVIDALFAFILAMLGKLNESIPLMIEGAAQLILGILKGVQDNIYKIVQAAIDICNSFINGITDKLPEIIDTAFRFVIGFIDGLAQAIENNHEALNNAVARLMNAIIDAIMDFVPKMLNVGKNIIYGIMDGFASMGSALVDAAKGVVGDAVDGVKNFLGIHSPSKVFAEIGMYSALGIAGGLDDYASKVSDAATNVGSDAVNSMSKAMSNMADVVNGNVDMTPTIRPVMDLSDVTAGAGAMNSLFNKTQGISVSSSTNKTANINGNMNARNNQNGSNKTDEISNIKPQIAATKTPIIMQLMLQNGQAIAEYIVDDLDGLLGAKTQITGRMVGI